MAKQPGEPSGHRNVRTYSKRISRELLTFTSGGLIPVNYSYVAWLDLMGAGHIMATSTPKAANFLVRLHMCVEIAIKESGYPLKTLPINDGIFIVSKEKGHLITVLQHAMVLLSARFISTPRAHDRCLLKGGIAYGPVFEGLQLIAGVGLKQLRSNPQFLERLLFGPAIIQAYNSEKEAPPFGIAVHESARSFSPPDEPPFNMTHWFWWQEHTEAKKAPNLPSLVDMRDVLCIELDRQFDWIASTLLLHGIKKEKVEEWRAASRQYLAGGADHVFADSDLG